MSKRGLGRGLDALLMNEPAEIDAGSLIEVDIDLIDPDTDQPRKDFDREKLEELAASIAEHGILQPILVEETGGRYKIIAGERRWRAARIAKTRKIPVLIRELDAQARREIALIENLQREDLNPVEEALAMQDFMREYDLTQEALAKRLGKSRPAVANALRLLSLDKQVLDLVREGKLSAGHARALAALTDAKRQREIAQMIIAQGLSVRQTEALLAQKDRKKTNATHQPRSIDLIEAEALLREKLGTKVQILGSGKKGSIRIDYYSAEDLERLYEKLSQQ